MRVILPKEQRVLPAPIFACLVSLQVVQPKTNNRTRNSRVGSQSSFGTGTKGIPLDPENPKLSARITNSNPLFGYCWFLGFFFFLLVGLADCSSKQTRQQQVEKRSGDFLGCDFNNEAEHRVKRLCPTRKLYNRNKREEIEPVQFCVFTDSISMTKAIATLLKPTEKSNSTLTLINSTTTRTSEEMNREIL